MRMSDAIAAYILHMLDSDGNGCAELQRNELAGEIGCAPSQINYVIGSRFTPEQGYIVESRRGGGGYIRIKRIPFQSETSMISHVINTIGDRINEPSAKVILRNLKERNVISLEVAVVISSAVSDQAYRHVPGACRDYLRADILKHMLASTALSL